VAASINNADAAWPARLALRCADWAERWFPDAYVFAALAVAIVAAAALAFGASPKDTAAAFGKGYWSLIPFTMQMVFVVIGGYVLASAPVVARAIDSLARIPRTSCAWITAPRAQPPTSASARCGRWG